MTNRDNVPQWNPYRPATAPAPTPAPVKPTPRLAAYAPLLTPADIARAHAAHVPVVDAAGQIVHREEA